MDALMQLRHDLRMIQCECPHHGTAIDAALGALKVHCSPGMTQKQLGKGRLSKLALQARKAASGAPVPLPPAEAPSSMRWLYTLYTG